jgi:hypothetical protein
LRAQNVGDLADAGEILRAAVDVDDALELREAAGIVRVHGLDDGALGGREVGPLRE